jgi:hypothetical protein
VTIADDEAPRHCQTIPAVLAVQLFFQHFVFGHSRLCYFLSVGDRMFISVQNIVQFILTLTLFVAGGTSEDSGQNGIRHWPNLIHC